MSLKATFLLLSVVSSVFGNFLDYRIFDCWRWRQQCYLPYGLRREIQSYSPIVEQIIHKTMNDFKGVTYRSLSEFVDRFGPRMSGSQSLEDSIDYMVDQMSKAGLDAYTEEATVPNWKRGLEVATILSPRKTNLPILGLFNSVATVARGITAEVVVVETFDELEALPDSTVTGKIVVFAQQWESYEKTAVYRSRGSSVAAKKGAVAVLIRSVTPISLGTLHTGHQAYEDGVNKIPAAAITVADAMMLLRMFRRGETIVIHINMDDKNLGWTKSRNTIGELKGWQKNSSVVVVSGHLDSWDVGVGAMDDGGGSFISWHAAKILKAMGLQPRRTIRAILWTAEEQGYWGAKAYQANHSKNEREEFNFFIESDVGTFTPTGMDFTGNKDAECIFKEILKLLRPINATQFASPAAGASDISVWTNRGFPGASLLNKNERYFWYHHSAADTMQVEDPDDLDKCTAVFAAVSYVIADLSVEMPKDVTPL